MDGEPKTFQRKGEIAIVCNYRSAKLNHTFFLDSSLNSQIGLRNRSLKISIVKIIIFNERV
jgi:hypothetical protein